MLVIHEVHYLSFDFEIYSRQMTIFRIVFGVVAVVAVVCAKLVHVVCAKRVDTTTHVWGKQMVVSTSPMLFTHSINKQLKLKSTQQIYKYRSTAIL